MTNNKQKKLDQTNKQSHLHDDEKLDPWLRFIEEMDLRMTLGSMKETSEGFLTELRIFNNETKSNWNSLWLSKKGLENLKERLETKSNKSEIISQIENQLKSLEEVSSVDDAYQKMLSAIENYRTVSRKSQPPIWPYKRNPQRVFFPFSDLIYLSW